MVFEDFVDLVAVPGHTDPRLSKADLPGGFVVFDAAGLLHLVCPRLRDGDVTVTISDMTLVVHDDSSIDAWTSQGHRMGRKVPGSAAAFEMVLTGMLRELWQL